MSLNPLRDALTRTGMAASRHESPFQAQAEASLSGFRAVREDLERRVKRGEITVKVAREQASQAASRIRDLLVPQAQTYSPVPRTFLDRLVQASEARKTARDQGSLESLQRETNRLLRQTLIEQQLSSRQGEFEGKAFVRPMMGGDPAPSLDSMLQFHQNATQAGDETAMEWARRHLESMRNRVFGPEDEQKIDSATDRPDQLNPRIVTRYMETLRQSSPEMMEEFVNEALAARDANACTAAFVVAREAPETEARWVRTVLDGVDLFPDAALNALRTLEADARAAEAQAALASADHAASLAQAEARFVGLEAPSMADLDRLERIQSRPLAAPDEPIGLALDRRGLREDEVASL